MSDPTKTCRRCGDDKPVESFRQFKSYAVYPPRPYRRSWCKECERTYSRDWRKKHPRYHADKSRGYRDMRV